MNYRLVFDARGKRSDARSLAAFFFERTPAHAHGIIEGDSPEGWAIPIVKNNKFYRQKQNEQTDQKCYMSNRLLVP